MLCLETSISTLITIRVDGEAPLIFASLLGQVSLHRHHSLQLNVTLQINHILRLACDVQRYNFRHETSE